MTYRMKKWQKLSTITLLMAGAITLNGGEFRSIDKNQIAVADTNVQTPDYEKLRNTWLDVNYGYDKYDEKNDAMKKKFEATENEAKKLLSEMKTESGRTYLWDSAKDLDNKSADMTRTYRNIEKIAEAMKHPKTTLNTDQNKNKVKDALEWLHKNAYGKEPTDKVKELTENFKITDSSKKKALNWWDYEIGTPKSLTNTLILLNGDISSDEKKKYTAPIKTFAPDSDKILSSVGQPEQAKGGNLVDITKVKLLESIIEEDKDMMKKSIDSFNKVFTYVQDSATDKDRNGFYKDGSYIDHKDVPYTGAYGVVLLEGISQMMPMIKETPFNDKTQNNTTLKSWIDDGFLPLIYKGEMMDLSRGRAISRENETSHSASATVMKSLLRLSDAMDDSTKAKYKKIVKTSVKSDSSYGQNDTLSSYSDISKMKSLMEDSTISTNGLTQQLKIYNDMDRVTYHNKDLDFAFGLSMTSKNVARYESINGENLKGWHTGAGMSYLYNSDVKHYRDNFWATADMKRLAGTTTLENEEPKGTDVKKSSKTFVGGTKFDDQHASIGMDFENQDKTLTAKKSYFILNDKIVFLGTGIKSTDSSKNPVTTIENRKANGYTLYTDDKQTTASDNQGTNSVFLESTNKPKNNIGYHFLNKSKISIKKETHTGNWKEINKSQKDTQKTDEYYEVTQKHSNSDNKYGYVLYPGLSKDVFKSKASQVTVVKQEDDFHVVKDNESVWAGVNYSDSAKTFEINGTKVEVKTKGMFILKKKDDKTYECSFYNPESTNTASDIESKISMTGYSITNKNTSTSNESGVRFELQQTLNKDDN
ncbi:polysaccharide lyase 8 family protein [Staphylococcus aureus]|jgi:Polysaccharide lyase family 8, C-terminal beta-sandwich domain./Polysaccharide lyase family 8, super-sandwich domain./Polysaccharide lyase family 8, N terminal alpha-helical domain.|uniref:Hyaluronate lyase n=12 Tax=Staphylococcus aureus TaxID=1280 RepID=A0AAN1ZRB0_STAAU|nr:polysaccharide lyase 8 family protein [Staphylococcus aureus]MRF33392.1 hyaluronate lyase [Staphylococcus sp. KY49P]HAR4233456.1 polysaccharide lyase 8 family protein [Staphylococcus aureus ADL-206]ANI75096.1 hyaluronate lyase [Staphylococcus aureus]EJX2106207.1 polysaccharide lyase 8 family protein [Staphylococcus aureus]EKI2449867.1 polysaccharide lyase 8 family protein [Staphylococcus aureus]